MNYLAHAFLAERDPENLIGNLAGDFVKGPLREQPLTPAVLEGVRLHRRVDAFTDTHPISQRLRSHFQRERRRYAGIVLDVLFDHFLARHWRRFSAEPRDDFIEHVYQTLTRHPELLPAGFRPVAPRMVAGDWLSAYARLDGVEAALRGIGRRHPRHGKVLAAARLDIDTLYPLLEEGFLELFPRLGALKANPEPHRE